MLHSNTLESAHGAVSLEHTFFLTGHHGLSLVDTLLSPAFDNQHLIFYFWALCSFNTIFVLIIWEVHIMHPDYTPFPGFPGPFPNPCDAPSKKEKRRKETDRQTESQEHTQTTRGPPLKEN